jgi:3-phytase/alkaline phosphatase D
VAIYAPYGPSLIWTYRPLGLLSEADEAHYWSLPVRNDADDRPDDRDDYVKELLDGQMARLGANPIGLGPSPGGSAVDARLLEGDYIAAHSYGWTEFAVDAATQALTVTTYGIEPYRDDDLAAQPDAVLARTPAVVSRFVVQPAR